MGIQVFPDTPEQMFEGIDLLDPTKLVPEEVVPVVPIGRLTLHANPTNFFAETEQVAFHPGHLPPGIDLTDDPLLQARLFSYIDTQITRLGGPNFSQIPINRPHAPVNDMFRDGFHQQADHAGAAPYKPNSLDGGCPFFAGAEDRAFEDVAAAVPESTKVRAQPASFDDHFSQARLFWTSMSPVEKEHIIRAYSFELGKCFEETIKARQLQCLANIDSILCAEVATALGLPAPDPTVEMTEPAPSPALSQLGDTWPTDGRVVGIVVDPAGDLGEVEPLRVAVLAAGMVPLVIAPHGGKVDEIAVQRTFATGRSVEYDTLVVAGCPAPAPDAVAARDEKAGAGQSDRLDPRVRLMIDECWRHSKAVGAWGEGQEALGLAGYTGEAAGVVLADDAEDCLSQLQQLMGAHRVWERFPATVE